jgi:hypothetical protein
VDRPDRHLTQSKFAETNAGIVQVRLDRPRADSELSGYVFDPEITDVVKADRRPHSRWKRSDSASEIDQLGAQVSICNRPNRSKNLASAPAVLAFVQQTIHSHPANAADGVIQRCDPRPAAIGLYECFLYRVGSRFGIEGERTSRSYWTSNSADTHPS